MSGQKVSIVVVNYNGKKYLNACLSSMENQTYHDFEVIFVDNASTDTSVEYVKAHFPSVRIIENEKNYGFAKGNNIGIKEAKGDLIATLNNDTEVTPAWLEELVRSINSDENVGMCASKLLFMKKRKMINSTGICISRSGACWDRGMFECDNGQYESIGEVFGPCAGAAMYRKSMLEEIGLFDEDFYAYMEDADLAFRGRLAGWKCLYVPKAVVYHVHGGTAGYATDYTLYYGNRNIIWNSIKNFPPRMLLTSLPWIIGRNIAVIPYYILKGHGNAILTSKIGAIKGIPKMLAKKSKCSVDENKIQRFIHTWASIPIKHTK
ncbi:MAG: glycosyltransferase family 2 protein [Candidatus Methanoperedens sp.]